VLQLTHIVARSRAGGVPIEQPTGIVYTIRDALIVHAETHLDHDVARAAAGLPS
jgi:hypothetical protein